MGMLGTVCFRSIWSPNAISSDGDERLYSGCAPTSWVWLDCSRAVKGHLNRRFLPSYSILANSIQETQIQVPQITEEYIDVLERFREGDKNRTQINLLFLSENMRRSTLVFFLNVQRLS